MSAVGQPGHLSHLTDIERTAYFQAVAEALALLNAEETPRVTGGPQRIERTDRSVAP